MTLAVLILTVVSIAIVFGFLLNSAALAVWADRRQSALVQHRVGPNRAVIKVPTLPMRLVIAGLFGLIAAPFATLWWLSAPGAEVARMITATQVAVFAGWLFLLILGARVRKVGAQNGFETLVGAPDPRSYFYGGVVAHLASIGAIRAIPAEAVAASPTVATGVCGLFAAGVIGGAGLYFAAKLPAGFTELRLAGTLHALADTMKMVWKEDLRPKKADKLLFALAPVLSIIPALITCAVIPFGGRVCFRDANPTNGSIDVAELIDVANVVDRSGVCPAGFLGYNLQIADINIGLLFVFAIAGTGIIGAAIAGWASDNKFALLGGLRATSQMVSYEVAMGLAITGVLMMAGSVHIGEIVQWQADNAWGIFAQPLAFFLFFASVVAETKRVPFDQPEGESEIVAGYFLEYSGFKWGIFMVGEYVEFIFSSMLMVTLFFGGHHLPFMDPDGLRIAIGDTLFYELPLTHVSVVVIGVIAFFSKCVIFTWFHIFLRWTLPRFRYDQLMKLGWTKLLPLSLVNILLTGLVMLAADAGGPGVAPTPHPSKNDRGNTGVGMCVGGEGHSPRRAPRTGGA
ncbi:MAG: complex I subunit 1 family protein [Myxococcota bacterium]